MGSSWDNQYDAFQGQSNFYDPSSSQYSYGDPSLQQGQSGNAYPNFMTPADPYSSIDQGKYDRHLLKIFFFEATIISDAGIEP